MRRCTDDTVSPSLPHLLVWQTSHATNQDDHFACSVLAATISRHGSSNTSDLERLAASSRCCGAASGCWLLPGCTAQSIPSPRLYQQGLPGGHVTINLASDAQQQGGGRCGIDCKQWSMLHCAVLALMAGLFTLTSAACNPHQGAWVWAQCGPDVLS